MYNGGNFQIQTDDDSDETISIDAGDVRPAFQIPSGPGSMPMMRGNDGGNMGMLINRAKVSKDVLSASSASVSGASEYSESEAGTEGSEGGGGAGGGGAFGGFGGQPMGTGLGAGGGAPQMRPAGGMGGVDNIASRMAMERSRLEAELNEKKEIMYQMDRLESKGYHLPKQFSIQSDLEEMRAEYHRILREKEVDASIRFQRKMMMAFVTGVEFMNTRFDPLDVKLEGWSEQVHENVNDYDDIFEELHEKYKSSGKKMAPELRLLMSLSGSAFMFHLTKSMFKNTTTPGVEQVLRNNPELMRQFQAAASQQMNDLHQASSFATGGVGAPSGNAAARGPGGGLFSMVGNLFGMGGGSQTLAPRATMPGPSVAQAQAAAAAAAAGGQPQRSRMNGPSMLDIDDVINDVQYEITGASPRKSAPPGGGAGARIERMSMSDEDITSLIESEIDGVMSENRSATSRGGGGRGSRGRRGGGAGAGKRVLDI